MNRKQFIKSLGFRYKRGAANFLGIGDANLYSYCKGKPKPWEEFLLKAWESLSEEQREELVSKHANVDG